MFEGLPRREKPKTGLDGQLDAGKRVRAWILAATVFLTLAYLIVIFLFSGFDVGTYTSLELYEKGGFLAGTFAGLAFLWFVAALIFQTLELEQNTLALKNQAREIQETLKESQVQTEALQNSTKIQSTQATLDAHKQYSSYLSSLLYNAMRIYCVRMTEDSAADLPETLPARTRKQKKKLKKVLSECEDAWDKYAKGDQEAVFHIFHLRFLKYEPELEIQKIRDVIKGRSVESPDGIVYPEARPKFLDSYYFLYGEYKETLKSLSVGNTGSETNKSAWLNSSISTIIYNEIESVLEKERSTLGIGA